MNKGELIGKIAEAGLSNAIGHMENGRMKVSAKIAAKVKEE